MAQHRVRDELTGVLVFIGLIWSVFLIDWVTPFNLNVFGVRPRTLIGVTGIPLMPFLHADLGHLLSNTVPLFVLLSLLAGSRAESGVIVLFIVFAGGALLWIFGRPAIHVGASGLVFGLIAFLLVSGFLEWRIGPLAISVLVGVVFGGTLLTGIVPDLGSHVSWEAHLCGAISGVSAAVLLARKKREAIEVQ